MLTENIPPLWLGSLIKIPLSVINIKQGLLAEIKKLDNLVFCALYNATIKLFLLKSTA